MFKLEIKADFDLIDENVIKKTRNDLIMRKSETLIKL
jgi:hypothetical protein